MFGATSCGPSWTTSSGRSGTALGTGCTMWISTRRRGPLDRPRGGTEASSQDPA